MIRIACPNPQCRAVLGVRDTVQEKVRCPKCGQRVQVSPVQAPPKKAEEVAQAVESAPPSLLQPDAPIAASTTAKAPVSAPRSRPRREDLESQPPAAKKAGSPSALWVACALAALILIGLLGTIGWLIVRQRPAPRETTVVEPEPISTPITPQPEPPKEKDPDIQVSPVDGERIYRRVLRSTIWVIASQPGRQTFFGTGSVVEKPNRLVLTNYHVVGQADRVAVCFPLYRNGQLVTEREFFLEMFKKDDVIFGRVVSRDALRDLAVIQLERLPELAQALSLAPTSARPGQRAHSVGNPGLSGGLWVYTSGTVRQVYRKKWTSGGPAGSLQHEATIVETQSPTNAGDSGGPLVNDRAELIAVTQGGARDANLLSIFIDVTEVRSMLASYAGPRGLKLTLETGGGLGSEANVPDLLRALEHMDSKWRAKATVALGEMGPDARLAVPALLRALKDPDELVRKVSAESLDKIGAPAKADLPLVIAALKDSEPRVRASAAAALGRLGADAQEAVPDLLALLKDAEPPVRCSAAVALGEIEAPTAAAALLQAAKDANEEVRRGAVGALAKVKPDAKEAVPVLMSLLKDNNVQVRENATRALANLGPEAQPAVGALAEALKDPVPAVRHGAVHALVKVGPGAKSAVPALAELLSDSDGDTRKTVMVALASLGPDAAPASPKLAELLKHADPEMRAEAAKTLIALGPEARSAVPLLCDLLDPRNRVTCLQAMSVLRAIGPDAKDAVPALVRTFSDPELGAPVLEGAVNQGKLKPTEVAERFRKMPAIQVLKRIGKPAVGPLVRLFKDPNAYMRLAAVVALDEIGPEAKDAIPALELRARSDTSPVIRSVAAGVVARIR